MKDNLPTEFGIAPVTRDITVVGTVGLARESGAVIRNNPEEIYDNSFVNNLQKSGILKETWGSENYRR